MTDNLTYKICKLSLKNICRIFNVPNLEFHIKLYLTIIRYEIPKCYAQRSLLELDPNEAGNLQNENLTPLHCEISEFCT